ncbi:MAG: adenylyl-sulfate kinase [Desulfobacterales bacterium]
MKKAIKQNNNTTWFNGFVTREDREKLHEHKGAVVWFTGLSASGKSTIAHHLEKRLYDLNCSTYVFDGDNVRQGLCSDIGFDEKDRAENIRRIGEMSKLFVDAGIIAITAFISPYLKDREKIKSLFSKGQFFEIFVDCPLDVCVKRDPKGNYKKAFQGIIKNYTGVSAPYETPLSPDLRIFSDKMEATAAADQVVRLLERQNIIEQVHYIEQAK